MTAARRARYHAGMAVHLPTEPLRALFIGDSITDVGRRDDPDGLGHGYVARIREELLCRDPAHAPEVLNRGVSGDTVRDLARRWQADVLDLDPDLLSVKIGVNDVWRAFGTRAHEAVPEEEFRGTLTALLRAVQAPDRTLVLVAPFMVEPDRRDEMRGQVVRRAALVAEVAQELGAALVELQPAFDRVMRVSPPVWWSADEVHPTRAGHHLIAREWLRVAGPLLPV